MENKSIIGIIVAVVAIALVALFIGKGGKNQNDTQDIQITGVMQELNDGDYVLSSSKVSWSGAKKTGEHFGVLTAQTGTFSVSNKKVTLGEVVLDMNSLVVEDIVDDAESNKKLTDHLKSEDFFDAVKNPVAKLVIKDWSTDNAVSLVTVRGIEKEIVHPVSVTQNPDGTVSVKTKLMLQNSDFNVGQTMAMKAILTGDFTVSFDGVFTLKK